MPTAYHFHVAPAEELTMIMPLWSFGNWRINLLGHFPLALGKVKYMIMPINYFMKWVKVEPLSTIIAI